MRGLREAFDFKAIAKEFSNSVIDFEVREAAPDLCFLDGDGWTAIAVVYFRMPGGNKFESLCVCECEFCNWYMVTPPIVTAAYTKGPNNGTVSRSHSLFFFRAPSLADT